jgi:rhodanese-related sulfurtransferase
MSSAAVPWEIDCRSVKEMLDAGAAFLFLDCREADEYAVARIPGATLVPMSELTSRVGELAGYNQGAVVVHCHHGGRSMRVAQWLRQNGFDRAQSMAGGIDQWSQEIDPSTPRY